MTLKRVVSLLIVVSLMAASIMVAQKETPPQGGTPKDFKLPKKNTITLNNGMSVTMVQYGLVPKVTVSAYVRAGNLNEKENEIWLAGLTGDLLKEGTTTRKAQDISREAAEMGGSVDISVGPDATTIGGDVLSEAGAKLVALLGDVIRHPSFPESELGRLKNDRVRELSVSRTQPQSITLEAFRKTLYGNHPYGRLFPTEEMLHGYTIAQIKKFYDENFCAGRTHMYIVGRFDAKAMERAVHTAFDGWKKGTPPLKDIPKPVAKREIHIIDRPGAAQSTVYIGLPVIDPSQKDYIPLVVTNALLGGSFGSRITRNIREDKGYTYSPSSQISPRYRDAYWVEMADVATDVTGPSLKEILYEVDRLQTTPPPDDELQGIQNYLAGTFVLRNSSRSGIIGQLWYIDFHGLPDSYLSNYVKTVYAVTPEKVQGVMKNNLRAQDMCIVIAGDRKKVEQQVASYGHIVN